MPPHEPSLRWPSCKARAGFAGLLFRRPFSAAVFIAAAAVFGGAPGDGIKLALARRARAVGAPPGLVKKEVKPESECSICLEEKTQHRILPCGHHFCTECDGRQEVRKCPVCRAPKDPGMFIVTDPESVSRLILSARAQQKLPRNPTQASSPTPSGTIIERASVPPEVSPKREKVITFARLEQELDRAHERNLEATRAGSGEHLLEATRAEHLLTSLATRDSGVDLVDLMTRLEEGGHGPVADAQRLFLAEHARRQPEAVAPRQLTAERRLVGTLCCLGCTAALVAPAVILWGAGADILFNDSVGRFGWWDDESVLTQHRFLPYTCNETYGRRFDFDPATETLGRMQAIGQLYWVYSGAMALGLMVKGVLNKLFPRHGDALTPGDLLHGILQLATAGAVVLWVWTVHEVHESPDTCVPYMAPRVWSGEQDISNAPEFGVPDICDPSNPCAQCPGALPDAANCLIEVKDTRLFEYLVGFVVIQVLTGCGVVEKKNRGEE